jgi:pectate lyase
MDPKIDLDRTYVADDALGVIARYADSDNLYRFFHNKGAWKLFKKVGGTASTLSVGPNFTLATGAEYDVKLVANGSSLKGYVNGVLQCSVTDTNLVSGKSGLYSYKSKGAFDDVAFRVIDSSLPAVP